MIPSSPRLVAFAQSECDLTTPIVPSRCGAFAVVHVNMCSRVGSQHLISTDQPRLAAAVSQP
jgi:hypothetical protein